MASESKSPGALLVEKFDTNKIAQNILKHATESSNEEELKIRVKPESHVIVPSGTEGREYSDDEMKAQFPHALAYFVTFFDDLVHRGGEPYKTKLKPYLQFVPYPPSKLMTIQKLTPPFYWAFNTKWALAPYKVCWKEISGRISGKGIFEVAVLGSVNDKVLGTKSVIPDHKLMFIPCADATEAHYVAAVLNSSISQMVVSGYTVETTMDTHIMNHVYVPPFDSKNKLHLRLAELSRRAHLLAEKERQAQSNADEMAAIEEEIDGLSAELHGISKAELEEIIQTLELLTGKPDNSAQLDYK
ncbi:MAG: hypothetical protein JRM80_04425 [Nitrososphaerota archaeon]|nr:hypothetical protein [Nitrososphaerota archaeon]